MPQANWWKLKAGKLVFWFEWNCDKGNKDTDILKWFRDDSEIRFKKNDFKQFWFDNVSQYISPTVTYTYDSFLFEDIKIISYI